MPRISWLHASINIMPLPFQRHVEVLASKRDRKWDAQAMQPGEKGNLCGKAPME